jgi:four helix bundle protein
MYFDHEKLDVYQLELGFVAWVATLLKEVRAAGKGLHREVWDQLDRASLSTLLNTAEGNGKQQGRQRAKFFDDARGSAVECAACLDALRAKGFVTDERIADGKTTLARIVGMLTKLVQRFDPNSARLKNEEASYGAA